MRNFYRDFETLGIVVCERRVRPPFAEPTFLRRLMEAGKRAGVRIFAFDPSSWHNADSTVRAWMRDDEDSRWIQTREHPPKLVYDRSWPKDEETNRRFRLALRDLETVHRFQYLNGKLPDKAQVYSVLAPDGKLSGLLPPTETYSGTAALGAWLDRQGGVAFLKPASGSQGRRVAVCARLQDGTFSLRGRTGNNRSFELIFPSEREAAQRIHRWIGTRRYLLQPLLELEGQDGEPFDIRALIQRNGRGRWALTGAAVRLGRPGSVTANLHGGGRAMPAEEKLAALFGPSRTAALRKEISESCAAIAARLEQNFGRFAEMGLDFGVDRSGRLWFLEANSKPGRAAMAGIGDAAARAAAERPVAYARSILLRPPGRVIHEFDHL